MKMYYPTHQQTKHSLTIHKRRSRTKRLCECLACYLNIYLRLFILHIIWVDIVDKTTICTVCPNFLIEKNDEMIFLKGNKLSGTSKFDF